MSTLREYFFTVQDFYISKRAPSQPLETGLPNHYKKKKKKVKAILTKRKLAHNQTAWGVQHTTGENNPSML